MTKKSSICAARAMNEEAVLQARHCLETRLPQERLQSVTEMFAAFGDPTRLKLLMALSGGELCVWDLSVLLGVSASAVSHQLHGLRALRLVKGRRDGKMTFYSLDDEHVLALLEVGLEHAREPQRSRVEDPTTAAV
jgi:DNA-binding transcriptional ArsR family regulator